MPTSNMASSTPKSTTATAYFFNGTTDGGAPSITFDQSSNLNPRVSQTVTVHDLRHRVPQATLTETKHEFVSSPTCLREAHLKTADKSTKANALSQYYTECARLVQSRTGCTRALAFHHRHREQSPPSTSKDNTTALHGTANFANKPVATFHVDNDASTALAHLHRTLGASPAADYLATGKRWGVVNIWRPLGCTVQQLPLALAVLDPDTPNHHDQTDDDTVVRIATPGNYKTHFIGVRPLSETRYKFWYTSRMTPDEALLFMDYDSAAGSGVSGVAHGAVEDHGSPRDAELRRSVEVRVLVLYD